MGFGLKAAVLGTGSIGYRHMQVLQTLEVPVVGVPIREARRVELRLRGWSCGASLREAREVGATLAVIATDTHRHAADTQEALELGFHVLLEKPMARSATEAKHLPSLAAGLGLGLFVGCPLRFDPGLGTVRERLKEIGAIHAANIQCRSYLPDWRPDRDYRQSYSARADEGGVLRDLVHEVDYAQWLFGVPHEVFGKLGNLGRLGIQSEEMAEGQWISSSGACVSIGLDYLSRNACRSLCAHGGRGDLTYDFETRKLRLQKIGATPEEITFPKSPNDIYLSQMNEFLRIVSGGRPCLIASASDGLTALAICDAWRQSSINNRVEKVML